ncbi:hypothetical protein QCA50_002083 [Cerrena zonata]|uniref:Sec39 domain-containing protein n=1 Tax=Cerrena zonata TaxID=2478898 RepID=A0AAW0GUK8_9APHY
MEYFAAAKVVLEKHGPALWPYRFAIFDSIPEHSSPEEYRDVLPGLDPVSDIEQKPTFSVPRPEPDWTEQKDIQDSLLKSQVSFTVGQTSISSTPVTPQYDALPAEQLLSWYRERINMIMSTTGMVDVAFSLVQHAASQGVVGLDEIGEDLSLISRLVYDTPSLEGVNQDEWTLERWKSLQPLDVVRAYLAGSGPESISHDITHLVRPYLYVLEARAERAGHPDPITSTTSVV